MTDEQRERRRAKKREYYWKNKAQIQKKMQTYYQENKERYAENTLKRKSSNPELFLKMQRVKDRRWRAKNLERIREQKKNNRLSKLEKRRAYEREYKRKHPQKKNPERSRKNSRVHYYRHRDEILANKRESNRTNATRIYHREWQRKRRAEQPDKVREKEKQARQSHPEYAKQKNHNAYARKRNAEGKFTVKQFQNLCALYGQMCLRCFKTEVKLTADHIVPLALGGTNFVDNIQPLCHSCNSSKQDTTQDYRFREPHE